MGFNPVDMEVRISELRERLISMETALASLKGYEFVSGPHAYTEKVSPRISLNTIIAGMIGLFIGLFAAFIMEYIERQRKAGL